MIKNILRHITIIIFLVISLFALNIILKTGNEDKAQKNDVVIENVLTEKELEEFDIQENNNIGNLEIPKINLKADISEGIDLDTLASYIGHFPNSSIWDGNVALAAHNRGSEVECYFENINKLEKGDTIIYRSELGERRYEIYSIREIEYTDWSVTESNEENIITLITCITNRPELRLCVQGKLI